MELTDVWSYDEGFRHLLGNYIVYRVRRVQVIEPEIFVDGNSTTWRKCVDVRCAAT